MSGSGASRTCPCADFRRDGVSALGWLGVSPHRHTSTDADDRLRLLVESQPDYAIFLLDPTGYVQTLERRCAAAQGLPGGRDHRPALLHVLSRGGRRGRGLPDRILEKARSDGPPRGGGLAGPPGRLAILGRCGDHRAARGRRHARRLRQGDPRPHEPPARPSRCGRARRSCGWPTPSSSSSACWSRACATTRSSCSTRPATIRRGTRAPSASRATARTRSSAATSRALLHRRGRAPGEHPDARAAGRGARGPLRGRGLARPQGRHAVLGQRRDHRAARRARRRSSASRRSRAT